MFAEAGDGDGEVLLLLVVRSFLCFWRETSGNIMNSYAFHIDKT